ncbi:MAG TPA: hypothetical protein VFF87_00525 [Hyphomicrobium sp.]|nr:hypothetical protein [Hyphomicrobium sp.]
MAANEKTSAAVAKIASKGLKAPGTLTHAEIKKLAASALTQAADVPKAAPAKKRTVKRKVASKPVKAKPVRKAAKKKR